MLMPLAWTVGMCGSSLARSSPPPAYTPRTRDCGDDGRVTRLAAVGFPDGGPAHGRVLKHAPALEACNDPARPRFVGTLRALRRPILATKIVLLLSEPNPNARRSATCVVAPRFGLRCTRQSAVRAGASTWFAF